MSSLVLGDSVATYNPNRGKIFSKFLGWLDRGSTVGQFITITTKSGHQMTLTKSHQAFVSDNGIQKAKVAQELTLQDKVFVWNGEELVEEEIESLDYVFQNGYRKPLTEEGTLLVDGILTSCYASYTHSWAELLFAPVKAVPSLLDDAISQHEDGERDVVTIIELLGRMLGLRLDDTMEKDWSLFDTISDITDIALSKLEL